MQLNLILPNFQASCHAGARIFHSMPEDLVNSYDRVSGHGYTLETVEMAMPSF
jgi:hypothetical protein